MFRSTLGRLGRQQANDREHAAQSRFRPAVGPRATASPHGKTSSTNSAIGCGDRRTSNQTPPPACPLSKGYARSEHMPIHHVPLEAGLLRRVCWSSSGMGLSLSERGSATATSNRVTQSREANLSAGPRSCAIEPARSELAAAPAPAPERAQVIAQRSALKLARGSKRAKRRA